MWYNNAVFVITEEIGCPIYNVDEEFYVKNMALTISYDKPVCLMLVQEILRLDSSAAPGFQRVTDSGFKKNKFECGRCSGLIRFECKKKKTFATVQMRLLHAAEKREKMKHVEQYHSLFRGMEIFESLSDNELLDLTAMLKLRQYAAHKIIINKDDRVNYLYIILSGTVVIVGDENAVVAKLGKGEFFGEMSLLSGELMANSVYTRSKVKLAVLPAKDFKHVLNNHPVLQVLFYRMLVNRAHVNTLRSGNISSGITGDLSEINAVELFQLINSSGKTGKIDLIFSTDRAVVLFNEGEIVKIVFGQLEGKEALYAVLAKKNGTFTFTGSLSKQDKELPVIGGFMGLMMEGLRRIDEND